MDSRFDHIKKQLSQSDSEIPQELSWENMETGILQEMETLDQEDKLKNSVISFKRLLLGMAVLLVLLLIPFLCTYESSHIADNNSINLTPANTNSSVTSKLNKLNSNELLLNSNEQKDIVMSEKASKISRTIDSAIKDRKVKPVLTSDPSSEINIPTKLDLSVQSSHSANAIPVKTDNDAHSKSTSRSNGEESTNLTTAMVDLLPTIEFYPALSSRDDLNLPKQQLYITLPKVAKDRLQQKRSFNLAGGVTWWSMGFGSNAPERKGLETTMPSFGTQLTYTQDFGKHWSFSIGLRYQRLESRFEHTYNIDDYSFTLTDTIIAVSNNLLTGAQTVVRGDVDLTGPAEVFVRHYNTIQLYQIPVTLGTWWQKGRWRTDIQLGASVNILSEYRGRTIFEGNVVAYSENSDDIAESDWKVNAMLRGDFSFQLTNYLDISSGLQVQQSLMNWSKENNTKMHPLLFSLELGCKYRF